MSDSVRVDVYRAYERVEARRARSWLLSNGIDDVVIDERVFRAEPDANQSALDHTGIYLTVAPERGAAARNAFAEATKQNVTFRGDSADSAGVG